MMMSKRTRTKFERKLRTRRNGLKSQVHLENNLQSKKYKPEFQNYQAKLAQ